MPPKPAPDTDPLKSKQNPTTPYPFFFLKMPTASKNAHNKCTSKHETFEATKTDPESTGLMMAIPKADCDSVRKAEADEMASFFDDSGDENPKESPQKKVRGAEAKFFGVSGILLIGCLRLGMFV